MSIARHLSAVQLIHAIDTDENRANFFIKYITKSTTHLSYLVINELQVLKITVNQFCIVM
jgi:hypothetical protein